MRDYYPCGVFKMAVEELIKTCLDEASYLRAFGCDVRVALETEEAVHIRNGQPDAIGYEENFGLGVRIYLQDSEGFASTNEITKDTVIKAVRDAFELALRKKAILHKNKLLPEEFPAHVASLKTRIMKDPFSVSISEKLEILNRAYEETSKIQGIVAFLGFIRSFKKQSWFANLAGSSIYQEAISCGAGMEAYALVNGELQRRSYPTESGNFAQEGYEFIESMNLPENARKTAEEAVMLCKAETCPEKETTVVIAADQMALQIHESIGHPVELDRVLGREVSLAGTSYLKPGAFGKKIFKSDLVNIVSDATYPGGFGSFFYDDEGFSGKKFYVIRNGTFVNFLTSADTAIEVGQNSNGCARADGAHRIPLVRMSNVNLEPGNLGFEELISDINEGIYLETTKSWSIDDLRMNFQFAVELAREIRNGKLGKLYKNVNYTGITPIFWSNLVSLGNENTFMMRGFTNCGKGTPIQIMHVAHGSPVACFRDVKVGTSK